MPRPGALCNAQVTLSGTINVSFYDQQAGYTPLHPVQVAALAQPQVRECVGSTSRIVRSAGGRGAAARQCRGREEAGQLASAERGVGLTRAPPPPPSQVITLGMDASSVPQKYLFTIYTQCFTFPEKLIFFLTGSLQVSSALITSA